MSLPKIIITTNKAILDALIEQYNLVLFKTKDDNLIFKPWLWNETLLVLYREDNISLILEYLFDNHLYEQIIYLWTAKKLSNQDLKEWDIVIPNTYITDKSDFAIFSTNTTWENYDLKKFWLILNWINLTAYKNEKWSNTDYKADIIDDEVYEFVKTIKKKNELENTIILKLITKDSTKILKESLAVVDFFL